MGTKERRERERQELKEKILKAARELFAAQGYEAVTMRQIAEAIEYSPTAIYLHFKDKRAVFNELCSADFKALAQEFRGIAEIPDPIERLQAAGAGYVRFALAYPHHYRLMFMTTHPEGHEDETDLEKGNPDQDAYAFLLGLVASAIAEGALRPALDDPELVAQMMWGAVHGVVAIHLTKGDDTWVDWRSAEETADLLCDVLMRGLARGNERG